MLITMLIAAVGANRTLLQRLLGLCALALAFRRDVFASLDVSHTAAATLPPSRRCQANGSLLDELLQGLLLCCKRICGRNPATKLCAADASPSGAGGCVAPVTQEAWLALNDAPRLERRGTTEQHARWKCSRCTALQLNRATLCSYRFFRRQADQSPRTGELDQPQAWHA